MDSKEYLKSKTAPALRAIVKELGLKTKIKHYSSMKKMDLVEQLAANTMLVGDMLYPKSNAAHKIEKFEMMAKPEHAETHCKCEDKPKYSLETADQETHDLDDAEHKFMMEMAKHVNWKELQKDLKDSPEHKHIKTKKQFMEEASKERAGSWWSRIKHHVSRNWKKYAAVAAAVAGAAGCAALSGGIASAACAAAAGEATDQALK